MSVTSVNHRSVAAQQEVPGGGRYSLRAPTIAKKIAIITLGTFAIHAVSSIPQAEGGLALMALCLSTCTAATGGAFVAACWAACCASVAAPTP